MWVALDFMINMNDMQVGADIVQRALRYPMKLIAKNAGVNGSVVIEKVASLITSCLCSVMSLMYLVFRYDLLIALFDSGAYK